MTDSKHDTGVILALAERFETQRLPRALAIKKHVDQGGLLSDEDMRFLNQVMEDARHIKTITDKHPKWQPVVTQTLALYKEIVDKALQNEQAKS